MQSTDRNDFFSTQNEYKDFYVVQQAILIGFLNAYYGVSVSKQKKQTSVTTPFPILQSINFGNDQLDVQVLADKALSETYQRECAEVRKRQTALRRFEKNKKIFVQHLLIDLLEMKGFSFESNLARNTGKTLRLERISKVFFDGHIIMEFGDVISRGYAINNYLNNLVNNGKGQKFIDANDGDIADIILSQEVPRSVA
ncbi:hypothetical protein EIN_173150 [Entamoeba invadens IP1]|uniref:Uncharacterized protein n=1 Tax=Entamoeba invadens IP1 TaxID=370355 RepID=A0A0A1TYL4_ENTIV|nr:hypothetical protein EIN_173150 [Entamoeba invadens IP1]ELP84650.1 hypothetical protein EIN_173150 [Entamoeba invadens IP1]|eukprot:XP_004183996.1 hypothetical protein EIN_173150 [Entamoeba invadens IP1]